MSTVSTVSALQEELAAPRRHNGLVLVRREWLKGLVSLLGVFEIMLALSARPAVAGIGVLSGILVAAAPWVGGRLPVVGLGLLVVGTLPFALVTWWSVIVPVVAVLALAIGVPVLLRHWHRT